MFVVLILVTAVFAGVSRASEADLAEASREYANGKFEPARASLDRFEQSSSPTVESLDLRGCILMEEQKFDDARKAFEDAHRMSESVFAPRLHLADLLLRQKKYPEAREAYETLLKETNILMSNERLRFAILLSYLGEKRESDAQQMLDAIPFPTETPAYYYAQAAWAFAHNNKSEGQDWLGKAEKVFEPEARSWFAEHLYDFGWLKKKPALSVNHG